MSLAHLQLRCVYQDAEVAKYTVLSPDFDVDHEWKSVAEVIVDKFKRDYEFAPLDEWKRLDLINPKTYALPLKELEEHICSTEHGHFGAWTGRIHEWVTRMIEKGEFPATYP